MAPGSRRRRRRRRALRRRCHESSLKVTGPTSPFPVPHAKLDLDATERSADACFVSMSQIQAERGVRAQPAGIQWDDDWYACG